MKKVILFASLITVSLYAVAQWQDEGTRYTYTPDVANHKSVLSASVNGGAYMIWQSDSSILIDTNYVTGTWFTLQAITDSGKVRSGWPVVGIRLSVPSVYAGGGRVITSEDGGAIVAWYANDSNNLSQIYVQKFDSTGLPLWNNGQPVQVSPHTLNTNIYPVLATDKLNGVYIAWTRGDVNLSFPTFNVIMQHINNLGQRDILWNPAGAQVAVLDTPQFYPQIAVTGDNSIYIAYAMGYFNNNEQLVLNKIKTSDGSVAAGWPQNGINITTPWLIDVLPHNGLNVFADNQNNAMLFWLDGHSNSLNFAVFMQLVSPTGQALLPASDNPPGGVHLLSDEIYQYPDYEGPTGAVYMQAARDTANNNYFVSFNVVTPDAGEYDLSLINIDAFGNIIWQDTLLTNNNISGYPEPVPDGKGGVYVFYDSLASNEYYVNAIGVNSAGRTDTAWTAYGPTFGTTDIYDGSEPVDDLNAVLTRKGEAMVTWQRFNTTIINSDTIGSYDIYACNLLPTSQTCTVNPAYIDTTKVDTSTAINPVNGALETLQVFPNPCGSQTTVYFSTSAGYNNLMLNIYNLSGQLIQESKITPYADNTISTATLAEGLYLYQLVGDNTVVRNGKLIKQ